MKQRRVGWSWYSHSPKDHHQLRYPCPFYTQPRQAENQYLRDTLNMLLVCFQELTSHSITAEREPLGVFQCFLNHPVKCHREDGFNGLHIATLRERYACKCASHASDEVLEDPCVLNYVFQDAVQTRGSITETSLVRLKKKTPSRTRDHVCAWGSKKHVQSSTKEKPALVITDKTTSWEIVGFGAWSTDVRSIQNLSGREKTFRFRYFKRTGQEGTAYSRTSEVRDVIYRLMDLEMKGETGGDRLGMGRNPAAEIVTPGNTLTSNGSGETLNGYVTESESHSITTTSISNPRIRPFKSETTSSTMPVTVPETLGVSQSTHLSILTTRKKQKVTKRKHKFHGRNKKRKKSKACSCRGNRYESPSLWLFLQTQELNAYVYEDWDKSFKLVSKTEIKGRELRSFVMNSHQCTAYFIQGKSQLKRMCMEGKFEQYPLRSLRGAERALKTVIFDHLNFNNQMNMLIFSSCKRSCSRICRCEVKVRDLRSNSNGRLLPAIFHYDDLKLIPWKTEFVLFTRQEKAIRICDYDTMPVNCNTKHLHGHLHLLSFQALLPSHKSLICCGKGEACQMIKFNKKITSVTTDRLQTEELKSVVEYNGELVVLGSRIYITNEDFTKEDVIPLIIETKTAHLTVG